MDVFEKRVIEAAESVKSKTVVIGGLCGCAWKTSANFEAYLAGPDFREPDEVSLVLSERGTEHEQANEASDSHGRAETDTAEAPD